MTSLIDKTYIFLARPMRLLDVEEVAAIDRQAFPTTWPPPAFRQELQNKRNHYFVIQREGEDLPQEPPPHPHFSLKQRLQAWLKQHAVPLSPPDSSLLGYCSLWCILDEAHLTAIAVREDHRRRGLGELLLVAALRHSLLLGAGDFTLETRVTNFPAQTLYQKYGLAQVGIRPHYYSDNLEDAYIMTARNIQSPEYRARLEGLEAALSQRLNWKLAP